MSRESPQRDSCEEVLDMDSLGGHVLQSATAGGRGLVRGGGHECGQGPAEHASITGDAACELDSPDKLDLTDGCSAKLDLTDGCGPKLDLTDGCSSSG